MKASSESGLWAMEISRGRAGLGAAECSVLTEAEFLSTNVLRAKEPLIKSALLKGTGFSPYVKSPKSAGLQPLRQSEIHKTTLIRGSLSIRLRFVPLAAQAKGCGGDGCRRGDLERVAGQEGNDGLREYERQGGV